MAEVIEWKAREPKKPTLDEEMQDIIQCLSDAEYDLYMMFKAYPGLPAKYAERLNTIMGNLCLTMSSIDKWNGN